MTSFSNEKINNNEFVIFNNLKENFKYFDDLNNLNHKKHIKARPPKESYLYFPSEQEICEITKLTNNDININRKLFEGNVKYSEYEKEKLNEFIEFCENYNNENKLKNDSLIKKIISSIIPHNNNNIDNNSYDDLEGKNKYSNNKKQDQNEYQINSHIENKFNTFNISKTDILRFLISFNFDNQKTIDSLIEFYIFQKKTFPIEFNENIRKIMLCGFIYIHGRDNRFRPIIILSPNVFLVESKKNKELTYKDWMLGVIYLLDYCINFLLIPGQVESWNIICDMKDVALYSVPNDLKNLLNIIQQNYKNRLNTMYVLNLSTFAGFVWNMIKGLMGESIQKKIKMINNKNNYCELYENINRSQLEKKYGGLAQNIELGYEDYFKHFDNNINYNSKKNSNILNNVLNSSFNGNNNSNICTNTNYECIKSIRDMNNNINNNISNEDEKDDYFTINKFYFPPNMPSNEYFTEKDLENIHEILITKEEYFIKIQKDIEIIKSPYYEYEQENINSEDNYKKNNINNLFPNNCNLNLAYTDSHIIFNDQEEFFTARDYIDNDYSSVLNQSIYSEIKKIRKEKEKSEYNDNNNSKIENKISQEFSRMHTLKKRNNNSSNKNILDLSKNNVINKVNKKDSNNKSKKVTLIKKNKDSSDAKKNLLDKSNLYEDNLEIEENEKTKNCKVVCGPVKVECLIF